MRALGLSFNRNVFRYLTVLLVLLSTTVFYGGLLESSMILHMLVQLPIIAICGYILSGAVSAVLSQYYEVCDYKGALTFILVSSIFMFWMIPKALDLSVVERHYQLSKYLSIFFMGLIFGNARKYMHPILVGILKFEGWAMLCRFGYGYMVAPQRLCSNYLLGEQILLGKILLFVAGVTALYWSTLIFFVGKRE